MTGTVIIIAVGIFVASLVALAANMLVPGGDTTATEDRLAQMASRRRGGGQKAEGKSGSLLMEGGFDEATGVVGSVIKSLPKQAASDSIMEFQSSIGPDGKYVVLEIGTYTVEIEATDSTGNRTAAIRTSSDAKPGSVERIA